MHYDSGPICLYVANTMITGTITKKNTFSVYDVIVNNISMGQSSLRVNNLSLLGLVSILASSCHLKLDLHRAAPRMHKNKHSLLGLWSKSVISKEAALGNFGVTIE